MPTVPLRMVRFSIAAVAGSPLLKVTTESAAPAVPCTIVATWLSPRTTTSLPRKFTGPAKVPVATSTTRGVPGPTASIAAWIVAYSPGTSYAPL